MYVDTVYYATFHIQTAVENTVVEPRLHVFMWLSLLVMKQN